MMITHRIKMNMNCRRGAPRIEVVQDDRYSRELALALYEGGRPWQPGRDVTASVTYVKSDGTGGSYNALPDGTPAWHIADNVVTVALAPQVCTAAGQVQLTVNLLRDTAQISTFPVELNVCPRPGIRFMSEDYYKLTGTVPDSGWTPNMYLGTDEEGRVAAVPAPEVPEPVTLDPSLTRNGQAADAGAVGERLRGTVRSVNGNVPDQDGDVAVETGGVRTVNGVQPDEGGNVEIPMPEAGLPLPAGAEAGQYLRVLAVDEGGRVTAVEAVELDGAQQMQDTDWLYNGERMPPLPDWDRETYPYAFIVYRFGTNMVKGFPYLYCVKSVSYTTTDSGGYAIRVPSTSLVYVTNKAGGGDSWESATVPDNINNMQVLTKLAWANFDVQAADGTTLMAGSQALVISELHNLNAPIPVITITTPLFGGYTDDEPAIFDLNSFDAAAFDKIAAKRLPCQVLFDFSLLNGEQQAAMTYGHLCAYFFYDQMPAYVSYSQTGMAVFIKEDGKWMALYKPAGI